MCDLIISQDFSTVNYIFLSPSRGGGGVGGKGGTAIYGLYGYVPL